MLVSFSSSDKTYGFTGEQQLKEVDSLVFLRARYYDPRVGRFISRDLGYVSGINLYEYVYNNPLIYTDPSGLDVCSDAKKQGLDKGSLGGVICSGGKKYSCVWGTGSATGATQNDAIGIIKKCTAKHEDDHHDDIDCPSVCGLSRPAFKSGKDTKKEECHAYIKLNRNATKIALASAKETKNAKSR